MKKALLVLFGLFITTGIFAQSQDCFTRLQKAFEERGSYTIADDMHRNVIISFFEPSGTVCLTGKVRVENGFIESVFIQYEDGDYHLYEHKFTNQKKTSPVINNGISEMIYSTSGEKFRIVFIEKLKPKKREYKQATIPDDL